MALLSGLLVPARGSWEREWPAWAVPRAAVDEWVALTDALAELGRPPACAEAPKMWWSKRPIDVEYAIEACMACPVFEECRAYAVAAGEREGVWGGSRRNVRSRRCAS